MLNGDTKTNSENRFELILCMCVLHCHAKLDANADANVDVVAKGPLTVRLRLRFLLSRVIGCIGFNGSVHTMQL